MEGLLLCHADAMAGPDEGTPLATLMPLCDEINKGKDFVFHDRSCVIGLQLNLLPRASGRPMTKSLPLKKGQRAIPCWHVQASFGYMLGYIR